jgi:hypothetical protein
MPEILLIDAGWDITTEYLLAFRQHFLRTDLAQHSVKRLTGPLAVKHEVDRYIKTNRVDYISGAGHGTYNSFNGYNDAVIWNTTMNLSSLRGSIVHLLSCETARILGRKIIAQGARGFWGYREKFRFIRRDPAPPHLHTDRSAGPAIMMDILIDRGILVGREPEEIYNLITDHFKRETARMPPFSAHRAVMVHNLDHLVCPALYWGGRNVRL